MYFTSVSTSLFLPRTVLFPRVLCHLVDKTTEHNFSIKSLLNAQLYNVVLRIHMYTLIWILNLQYVRMVERIDTNWWPYKFSITHNMIWPHSEHKQNNLTVFVFYLCKCFDPKYTHTQRLWIFDWSPRNSTWHTVFFSLYLHLF